MSTPINTLSRVAQLSLLPMLFSGDFEATRQSPPFHVAKRSIAAVIRRPGNIVLEAKCRVGEQLIGGGYMFLVGKATEFVGVLSSYPSALDTWTVTVDVPESPLRRDVEGKTVIAVAYCVAASAYPLEMTITSRSASAGLGTQRPIVATCPSGSTLTGGGYRTRPSGTSGPLFNEHVLMSAPSVDAANRPTGWQVVLDYPANVTAPITTAYALCAGKTLTGNAIATDVLDVTRQTQAFGQWHVEARCDEKNTFTVGGGYWILGDPLIAHPVSQSSNGLNNVSWQVELEFGYQTPNYKFRPCDPALNPDCAKTAAVAVCLNSISSVKVKITSPAKNADIKIAGPASQGVWRTVPVTFTADAFAEDGTPLTGNAVQWFQNGVLMGSGNPLRKSLLVGGKDFPAFKTFIIRAVATGKTTTARDEIRISAGSIE